MNIVFVLAVASFGLWVIRNTLFWVGLWQLKEYRFDRLLIHLKETTQGKNILFSPLLFLKLFTLFAYLLVVDNHKILSLYQVAITTILCIHAVLVFREIALHVLKRPVLTFKAIFIIAATLAYIFFLVLIAPVDWFLWLLFLERLVPFVVSFFVLLLAFPTEFYRDLQIDRAIKKIRLHKNLLVIGITGSYGKSSTKAYVAQILEARYQVLKTKGTNNTPIGIAKTILEGLKDTTEIFVVEMGAYKRREIAEMCQIVRPQIGILTAISPQHQSLFGSIENTMKAKYELIESLPKNGIGIFNGNNEGTYKLYRRTKLRKVLYKAIFDDEKTGKETADIVAKNIELGKSRIAFDAMVSTKTFRVRAPLIGTPNVENILPGIYLATHLGMSEREIKKAVSVLSPLPKTMARYTQRNGATIIDDTFNANPEAIVAALRYIEIFKGKKFLVLQPMIELGKIGGSEHYRVAKEIAKICDYLLLTNKNFNDDIVRGLNVGKRSCTLLLGGATELSSFITKYLKRNDVVLFEGKEADFVLSLVMQSHV